MFSSRVVTTSKGITTPFQVFQRNMTRGSGGDAVSLSNRRVMRKIKMGKARPAIFYQFDTLVELSDGSVVKRRSQAPKDEIRMISDQRNSTLWNPNRSDIVTIDPNSTGKVHKFKQRFAFFEGNEEQSQIPNESADAQPDQEKIEQQQKASKANDDFLDLLGQNAEEVQKGGKLFNKKESRNRK
ncbi:hypothetical protein DFJ63DRAFT_99704 [Scheffersomyces coipomensis]|uniref:uncharacterized protein n=1 Tax=Scheffersomyces coipomensis TaxID=1788519 RepID=UPI00315D50D7